MTSILPATEADRTLAPGVHLIPTQGNSLGIETADGAVVIDAGPGGRVTAGQVAALRRHTDAPVRAIVYSHGHAGYNGGVAQWQAHAAERGEPAPELIAHHRVLARYARYRETRDLQALLTSIQFPGLPPAVLAAGGTFVDPGTTIDDELRIDDPDRPVVVRAAPSETDDAVTVWLPEQGILYGGAATPGGSIPNIGTPLRTQRHTVRWAETLEAMEGLGAEVLVQEFGPVVEGAGAVSAQLRTMADALRWLRAEVVARMARGLVDTEILAELAGTYPSDLFDQPYMAEVYGARDYIVRDLFREENGWWTTRNPADLHPPHPDEVAAAVRGAVDPARVLAQARALADDGRHDLALAVVDLLALAPGDDPDVVAARDLKADWCDVLADGTDVFVSQSLYRSSARLLRAGHRRWSEQATEAQA